jgi:uncharacterized membrane protein
MKSIKDEEFLKIFQTLFKKKFMKLKNLILYFIFISKVIMELFLVFIVNFL